jgi:predicted methyltransferase
MRRSTSSLFLAALLATPLAFAADVPAPIAAAVSDSGRPADDKARDADRKPGPPRPDAPEGAPAPNAAVTALAAEAAYPNIKVTTARASEFTVPEPVDVVWTSLNYHDFRNAPNADMKAFNANVLKALKPGGTYIVIDHAAEAGSGARDTQTLHRIDPELVKSEVVSAGFKFEGASDVLKHPDDPHTARVHDASVRGKTDQFLLKFSKPK